MFDVGRLHAVEQECGFRYPPELWAAIDELAAVARLPGFAAAFSQARLPTAGDVAAARGLGMDEAMVPFMCEPQRDFADYYCCARDGVERGRAAVAVFAVHTVVADWPSFAGFIEWARHLCNRPVAEPGAAADGGGT